MNQRKPINRKRLIELHSKHEGRNWKDIAYEYNQLENDNKKPNSLRAHYSRYKDEFETFDEPTSFNALTDKIIDEELDPMTEEDILELANLDKEEFQLRERNTGIINRWWLDSEGNKDELAKRIRNGQVKVYFEKRRFELNQDNLEMILKNAFNDKVKKVIEPNKNKNNHGYMLIPLKDMHIKNAKQYAKHQQEIYNWIKLKYYKEIAFIIGSDLFNTNDSKGRTYNDTYVDCMETTISYRMNEARKFYEPLIDAALEQADKVHIIYEPGNHDRDTAASFVTALSWVYQDNEHITFDLKDEDYKLIQFNQGRIAIATHHGDKKSTVKAAAETFHRYFGRELALSDYCEGLIGHKHHRWSGEHMNLFIQGLSTAADDTKWERSMGFANGYKAFTIRIYDDYGLKNTPIINGSSIQDLD